MIKRGLSLIVFLLLCVAANAQGFRVSGVIADKSDNSTLPSVNVFLYLGNDTVNRMMVITSIEGAFSFENVQPGNYILKTSLSILFTPKK